MLVTGDRFFDTVQLLASTPEVAVDCETTGLFPFKDDRLFSVIFATATDEYYFNFQNYQGETTPEMVLSRALIPYFSKIFQFPGVLYGHNLIFDLQFLAKEGLKEFNRDLWCTEVGARLEYNDHLAYGLDACAKRIGEKKDDAVKEHLDKNKLYHWETDPGKKSRRKIYYFDRVPLRIIHPYGEQDARVCFKLAQKQRERFREIDSTSIGAPKLQSVAENERRLTGVLFKMQRTGMRLDIPYCKEALAFEQERAESAKREFTALTGEAFVDSAKSLGPALVASGVALGVTEKGAVSIADDVLSPHAELPLVKCILDHRDATKRANTYWSSYLQLVGNDGRIHAWLRQAGTATGRFGCREPNLQNLTKKDASKFPIRRAFVPDDGYLILSVDYSQQEYRLMLDYCQEIPVIREILDNGLDVHTATALMMGSERNIAKTINFLLLYGGGVVKLTIALMHPTVSETSLWAIYKRWKGFRQDKWTPAELQADKELTEQQREENLPLLKKAEGLRSLYFEKLPKVSAFIGSVRDTALRRGYLFNWAGRRLHFPNPQFAYAAPNHLIQSGGADIMKLAMVRLDEFLTGRKTKLLMNVHDELLYALHPTEVGLVPDVQEIMRKAYTPKLLPMDCDSKWSAKSWGDLQDGLPI